MSHYEVELEVSGPSAMWTRPDTGDAPVSYPAPTFGAVKGIFESILLSEWGEVLPTRVEVCRPLVYHTYTTNYGGPLRKSKVMAKGSSYQLLATVLINVCYRFHARIESVPAAYAKHGGQGIQQRGTTNGAHAYQEMFERRLRRGQLHYTPFLGWKEFTPGYLGPLRSNTRVCEEVNVEIPSMLRTCFSVGKRSAWSPRFVQALQIRKGVLEYAE
ncbi:MAG: CRISPR-associated protein Cas5 [Planctomycetes bacterium]|nr:CRISPR-associated protein Cas5 [Planctomycetota bacterium]